jgi:hypothetical protein
MTDSMLILFALLAVVTATCIYCADLIADWIMNVFAPSLTDEEFLKAADQELLAIRKLGLAIRLYKRKLRVARRRPIQHRLGRI